MIEPSSVTEVRPRMGTLLAVTVVTPRADVRAWCLRTVFDVVAASERLMSRHDATTALSRLNAMAGVRPGLRSPELARILTVCRAMSELTEGAFDATVGALGSLWRRAAARGRPPSRGELGQARARVGWHGIEVNGTEVALAGPGIILDLGGLGKGFALDHVAAALEREPLVSGLLNFGESSLIAIGRLPETGWRILLRHPLGGFAGEFMLRARACSTSATFGQSARVGRRVIGHIVDPRSGHPTRRAAQVTVLSRSAAVAEALSTALLVLGRSAIDQIAKRTGAEVCWIDRSGINTTAGFELTPIAAV